MSKVCFNANACLFKPEQSTYGCPCANLCLNYCSYETVNRSHTTRMNDDTEMSGISSTETLYKTDGKPCISFDTL